MRKSVELEGITVKAYAGSTGVLLAMNVTAARRRGLLGFAIYRTGSGDARWLSGMLTFEGANTTPGAPIPTNVAPIQKFRWSDYTVMPDSSYRYTVHPVYGKAGELVVQGGPTVSVRTEGRATAQNIVIFNRAAAASQAFSRDFPYVEALLEQARKAKKDPVLPPDVLTWLSRGVLEQIEAVIAAAVDEHWALDVAIYEYELPAIIEAVEAAHERGALVRVLYHSKKGDTQTEENEAGVAGLPAAIRKARVTSAIFHDKFIVLSKMSVDGRRLPQLVLCGSTNFTHNGVYRQANVVQVLRRKDFAARYLELFEVIFGGATPTETRHWIDANNPLDPDADFFVGFSPRTGRTDLAEFNNIIGDATRDVLFCTAFDLDDGLEEALLGEPDDKILRFGVENTRSSITGFHRDRTAQFAATAFLSTGLEGFLKESTAGQKGNILIHTKIIVTDFTSDTPTVISGSHNLSGNASDSNDENYIIARGDTALADCYGVELMRIYDHYRFRWVTKEFPTPPGLTLGDEWTNRYFVPGLYKADREMFASAK